jgi:hypothetical protein
MAAAGRMCYHILGKCDSEDFGKAEALASLLQSRLPAIACEVQSILPSNWKAEYSEACTRWGLEPQEELQPLVWTDTGTLVGDLSDFVVECKLKYGVDIAEDALPWRMVARQNWDAQKAIEEGTLPTAQLPTGAPGAAVCEELLAAHERYVSGVGLGHSLRAVDGVAATVLMLHPLGVEPCAMFDQPEDALFVIPCKGGAIDDLIIGNLEHGAVSLHAHALAIVGCDSPEMRVALQAASARISNRDEPLPQHVAKGVEKLMPALLRVLGVASPGCDEAELVEIAVEECVREACDEVLRASPLLSELVRRGKLAVLRLAYAEGSGLRRV